MGLQSLRGNYRFIESARSLLTCTEMGSVEDYLAGEFCGIDCARLVAMLQGDRLPVGGQGCMACMGSCLISLLTVQG